MFEFGVDRTGETLTLQSVAEDRKDRIKLAPGNPAPDFEFLATDGRTFRLSDHRGQVVLLYFWGTWCGPCRASTPRLVETYGAFRGHGLEILGIAEKDTLQSVLTYTFEHGMSWPQTLETDETPIANLYRVNGYPTLILIDAQGEIIYHELHAGGLDGAIGKLLPAISDVE